jgi:hypothetical protein
MYGFYLTGWRKSSPPPRLSLGRAAAEDTVPQRIEEDNKQANSDERPAMTLKEGCAGLTLNLG